MDYNFYTINEIDASIDQNKGMLIHKNIKKKIIVKLFSKLKYDIINHKFIIFNSDLIDDNMFRVGIITDYILVLNFGLCRIEINLVYCVIDSLYKKNYKLTLKILSYCKKIINILPEMLLFLIPYIGINENINQLILFLLNNKINISINNYQILYKLAFTHKFDIMQYILDFYSSDQLVDVINKICIHAIYKNNLEILIFLLPPICFKGAYDLMECYLSESIRVGANNEIINFFIDNGVQNKNFKE